MTDEPVPCRGFPVFSLPSVRLIADHAGVQDVSDEVLLLVSEDLTYRVREMISHSIQFTKHSGRTRLSVRDVEKALQFASIDPCGSCSCGEDVEYCCEEGIFFVSEKEADLIAASNEIIECDNSIEVPPSISSPSLHWLAVDGRISSQFSDDVSTVQSGPKLTPTLINYCECIVKTIFTGDAVECRIAFQDLAENSRIQPIVGPVLSALQTRVKSPDLDFKTALAILTAFGKMLTNESFLLALPSHQKIILDTALDLAILPASSAMEQDNLLRQRAAAVLALVTDIFNSYPQILDMDPKSYVLNRLELFVSAFTGDLSAMSGVLLTCLACGSGHSAYSYLKILEAALQAVDGEADCNQKTNLMDLFPAVAGTLMSHLSHSAVLSDDETSYILRCYLSFYESFADSLTCFFPHDDCIWTGEEDARPLQTHSLGWIEEKTGEDLLDSFYLLSHETAPVNDNKLPSDWRGKRRGFGEAHEVSHDVMDNAHQVKSCESAPHPRGILTACTIFENYAAFPRKRKIKINCKVMDSSESEAPNAAGRMTDVHSDEVGMIPAADSVETRHGTYYRMRKEKRVRLHRNPQSSRFSCILINCFL